MSVQSSKTSIRHAQVDPVDPGCPSGVVKGSAGLIDFIKGIVPLKVVFPMSGLRVPRGSPGRRGPVEVKSVTTFLHEVEVPNKDVVSLAMHISTDGVHDFAAPSRILCREIRAIDVKTLAVSRDKPDSDAMPVIYNLSGGVHTTEQKRHR